MLSSLEMITKYISKGQKILCKKGKYQSSIKRNLFGIVSLLSRSREILRKLSKVCRMLGPTKQVFGKEFENITVFLCFVVILAQVQSSVQSGAFASGVEAGGLFLNLNQSLLEFYVVPLSFPLSPILLKKMKLNAQSPSLLTNQLAIDLPRAGTENSVKAA